VAAGVNKRMLYHYFGSKDGLWAALLADQLGAEPLAPAGSDASIAGQLAAAAEHIAARPGLTRLLVWEALSYPVEEMLAGATRTLAWQHRVARVQEAQRDGRLSQHIDAAQLELALAALVLFPFAFPQLARMITGHSILDPAFTRDRAVFFEVLAALLKPAPQVESAAPQKKPRFRLAAAVTEG
jgi:AcrR family transcriptional regulator